MKALRLVVLAVAVLARPALAQDPLTKQALGRIEQVEKAEPAVPSGDRQAALRLINNLDWAGKRLRAVVKQDEATWKDASRRYTELRAKLEAKANATPSGKPVGYDVAKLEQLDKAIRASVHNFEIVPRKLFVDTSRTRSIEKELAGFDQRMAEFPADDDRVKATADRLAAFHKAFDAVMAQVASDGDAADAITLELAELDAKYASGGMPAALEPPLDEERLRAWAADLRRWRDVEIKTDLVFLEQAAANTKVDAQHVSRLRHWLGDSWLRRLAEIDDRVHEGIESSVKEGQEFADFLLETDANDRDQVVNRILGKGRFDENMARLREGAHAVAMAVVYDEAMSVASPADRSAAAKKVDSAIAHLKRLAVNTLDAVRMPGAATADEDLLRIASETLAKPDYGVKGWLRLVVNSDKVRKESREAWLSGTGASRTLTMYHYVWDEFQVATAEQVGDEVWIYFNRFKLYHSGDTTKPIGRWVLSQRFESTRILPENVDK